MAFVALRFLLIAKSVDFRFGRVIALLPRRAGPVRSGPGRAGREMICYRNYTAHRRRDSGRPGAGNAMQHRSHGNPGTRKARVLARRSSRRRRLTRRLQATTGITENAIDHSSVFHTDAPISFTLLVVIVIPAAETAFAE